MKVNINLTPSGNGHGGIRKGLLGYGRDRLPGHLGFQVWTLSNSPINTTQFRKSICICRHRTAPPGRITPIETTQSSPCIRHSQTAGSQQGGQPIDQRVGVSLCFSPLKTSREIQKGFLVLHRLLPQTLHISIQGL